MGTDYGQGEGVLVDIETLLKVINDNNKSAVIEAINRREWFEDCDDEFPEPLKELTDEISTSDLKQKLNAMCEVGGEPGRYEGNCHLIHAENDSLCYLFNVVLRASGTNIPFIDGVRVFDSYRKHESCPIGEVSFIIERDDVYISTLSDAGKALEELCGGRIRECTWTEVSY